LICFWQLQNSEPRYGQPLFGSLRILGAERSQARIQKALEKLSPA
jgi:hypothetical protein